MFFEPMKCSIYQERNIHFPAIVEPKLDGIRVQIHVDVNKNILLYSRRGTLSNQEFDKSIVDEIRPLILCPCVLDGEIVAYDRNTNSIQPFSCLQNRKNTFTHLAIFVFDILSFQGNHLLHFAIEERKKYLTQSFEEKMGVLYRMPFEIVYNMDRLNQIRENIPAYAEGLIIKFIGSVYEGRKWLKLKNKEDTMDLAVIGMYKGKRPIAGSFLLAKYVEKEKKYRAFCKVGTGFTEEEAKECLNLSQNQRIPPISQIDFGKYKKPHVVFNPPSVVAEVAYDSKSKNSVRFPRFIRFRNDKSPRECF